MRVQSAFAKKYEKGNDAEKCFFIYKTACDIL